MKIRRKFKFILPVLLASLTLIGFQNCNSFHASDLEVAAGSTSSSSLGNGNSVPVPGPSSGGGDITPPPSLPLPGPLPAGATFDITTLKPNSAAELTTLSDCPVGSGVMSGCGSMSDYGSMLFDESQGRFLFYGGGHGPGRSSSLFSFDLKTQRWQAAYVGTDFAKMYTPLDQQDPDNTDLRCFYKDTGAPVVRHTYDMMEIVPDLNGKPTLLMLTSGGIDFTLPSGVSACTIGHYDITDRHWTWTDTKADSYYYYASASAYDPVSKRVIIIGNGPNVSPTRLLTYDPSTHEVKAQMYTAEFGYDNNLTYFPPNDRFYLFVRGNPNKVYEIAVDRNDFSKTSVTLMSLAGEAYTDGSTASGWKYDADNQVIAGGINGGKFYYLDPIHKTWGSTAMNIQVGGTSITATAFHNIAYDSLNKIWVFVDNQTKKTWAYRFQRP